MPCSLPTAEELEKLSLRAVVVFAARTARRISSELRGVVPDHLLDDALRLAEAVATRDLIAEIDPASVVSAAERVAAGYADSPTAVQSPKRFSIVFALIHTALAAMYAILAAKDPNNARHQMRRAAENAQRAIRPIKALDSKVADIAIEAARQDYEILLREYGEHEDVVIGEAIHCFDTE
jgi:hypothetical protein